MSNERIKIKVKGGYKVIATSSKDFFFCYDERMKNELEIIGFKCILKTRHWRTYKIFYLFSRTEELNNFLKRKKNDAQYNN